MARRDDDDRLGTARDEAERLIAAALAAASFASRQAARRSRERERGRRDDSLGDDLAGLAGAATRLVGDWFGTGRDRGRRRGSDRYDGYGRGDSWAADRDRAGNGDRPTAPTHHVATGSEACCSCPVCRAIDFVREPPPEFVERVATGASDLASGVTSMLRAFGDVTGVGRRDPRQRPSRADVVDDYPTEPAMVEPTMAEPEPIGEPAPPADSTTDVPGASEPAHTVPPTPAASRRFGGGLGPDFSSVWQAATRAPMTDPPRRAPHTPKPMAKKAVKAPVGMPSEPPPPRAARSPIGTGPPEASAAAKRAPAKAPTKSTSTKSTSTKSTSTKPTSTKPTSTRSTSAKSTSAKAAGTKSTGTKATGTKSAGTKAAGTKATAAKATGTKAAGTKATGAKAAGTKATAAKATGTKAAGTKATAAKATGTKAAGTKAAGTKAAGTKAAGTKAAGTKAAGAKATGSSATTRKATAPTSRTTRRPRG
jgi:hypothetical protein